MRRIGWGVSPAALAVLLLACASDLDFGVSHDPLASFPDQATYLWDEAANSLSGDERVSQLGLDELIREIAEEAFASRGYRRSESRKSQYLLSYQASLATRNRPERVVAVGSLSLMLEEAASGRRVWVGFMRTEVDGSASRELRRQRLRSAIAEMLAEFPPRP